MYFPLDADQIAFNKKHFVELSFKILSFLETLPPETRGRRLFTLAPLKGDFVEVNITLNSTTLINVFAQMTPEERLNVLHAVDVDDDELNELVVCAILKPAHTITAKILAFKAFSRACLALFFNTRKYERGTVKFDGSVKTNGYTACVLFATTKQVYEQQPCLQGRKLIAIDPGVGNLITCCYEDGKMFAVSGKEHRHRAKFHEQKEWENGMRSKHPEYTTMIKNMPSMKTSLLDTLVFSLQYRLDHFEYLFGFCSQKPFLKWRFTTFVYSQKALTWMAKNVVGDEKNCVIGFGDWSQVDGVVKGHPKAPNKRIKRALSRVATVVNVDEYRSSMVCSCCKIGKCNKDDHRLKKTSLRNKDGEAVPCHFVLSCLTCNTKWQRDINASRNLMAALKCQVTGRERPQYLRRESPLVSNLLNPVEMGIL